MRIGTVGFPYYSSFPQVALKNHQSLFDFDIIYFDPAGFIDEWLDGTNDPKDPLISSPRTSEEFRAFWKARKGDFNLFLSQGKAVVLMIRAKESIGVIDYDGNDPRRVVYSLSQMISPAASYSPIPSRGKNITFRGKLSGQSHFQAYCKSINECVDYDAYVEKCEGAPFLFVEKTNRILGSHVEFTSGGDILLVPRNLGKHQKFIEATTLLLDNIRRARLGSFSLMPWAKALRLPGEDAEVERQVALIKQEKKIN
jgi:hypothetical protein